MGVGLGSCAKAQGLLLADIAVGLYFNALTLALSLRERGQKESLSPTREGTKGKPPSRTGDKYEDEEVSGTGLGRKLGFV